MEVKLGKREAKKDPRTLRLASYLATDRLEIPIPESQAWSKKVAEFPMYDNDRVGNCAIAGPAHLLQVWTANDGKEFTPRIESVMEGYSRFGYQPSNPQSDVGCILLDVMREWRNVGFFGEADKFHKVGHKRIGAYALVNPGDHALTCTAIHLFGGLTIGLQLPAAVQGQDNSEEWRAPGRNHRFGPWAHGSWGGHCVVVTDYDPMGLTCVTWGGLKRMSWQFYESYCDEAFAAISQDWVGRDSKAPNGFNALQLAKDLRGLK